MTDIFDLDYDRKFFIFHTKFNLRLYIGLVLSTLASLVWRFAMSHRGFHCYDTLLTRALIVSLTEEEQTTIDQIAERVANGGRMEERKLKAQSLSNESLR